MGAQEPGSPAEAGSTGACQMATGATEEMQGLLEKPSETVRGETHPACPSYPRPSSPGAGGAHWVTPARSQPSQEPGSTEGETGSCDDEWA